MEASVSTAHAVVFHVGGKRYLRDLGSRTGTFVNGKKIHQQELNPGDTLRIGETDIRYARADAHEHHIEPVFAEIERRGLVLLMHPTSAIPEPPAASGQSWRQAGHPAPSWDQYTLTTILAWPNETARATARLIFAGTLERHPELHLVLSHGGGPLPFLRGRLNLAYSAPEYEYNADCHAYISKQPGDYFGQLLFDTAVGAPESLHFLIDTVGADRVVFGTDDPFEIGDTGGRMALPALRDRDPAESAQILGSTLAHLIGR